MKKARRRRNKPTVKARARPRRLKQLGLGSFCRIAYIGLGVALLPLALLASLDYSPHVDSLQTIFWFYSYEHGYVQRGLWGTIISYFYDSPSIAEIHPLILRLEKIIIIATIFMTWALLVLKIWMGCFSAEKKLMLVAFAGVFMLAPVWKMFGHIAGFGDEWAFFFALLALISFIGKLPYLYPCFIIIAYLCHPQGVLYACLLTVFIAHSLLRNPAYAQRWRAWVIAVLMPFCAVAVLYSISSQEAVTLIYEQYSDEFLRIMPPEIVSGMLKDSSEGGKLSLSRTLLEIAASPHLMIAYSATLGLPMLVYAALLAYAIGNRTTSSKTEFFAGQPIVSKLVPYERYIVIVGSSLFTVPMIIAGARLGQIFSSVVDWHRNGNGLFFMVSPRCTTVTGGRDEKKRQ